MVNKFEVVGIAGSIGIMVLALWFIQQETTSDPLSALETEEQTAAVYIADDDNRRAAVADAVVDASDSSGDLERLIIDDVTAGEGALVQLGDTVTVHYIGTLQNGQQFDNSYLKGAPFTFTLGEGRVIEGWDEGVLGMKVGGQRILVIPPELAYGKAGAGPIPPNATLVFAIELLEIN